MLGKVKLAGFDLAEAKLALPLAILTQKVQDSSFSIAPSYLLKGRCLLIQFLLLGGRSISIVLCHSLQQKFSILLELLLPLFLAWTRTLPYVVGI
ncbi:hypothetical protein VNO77_22642 [Canavalia gladiata]|uniref:Uncharacterized protein n=1 Tax=Canavalia gladiata TaxID=3824 RepID=A0AAN9QAZ3_CANGL